MVYSFVILHYNCIESTISCVDSILDLKCGKEPHIVIVDNASPNGSGKLLEEKYASDNRVKVILNSENLGFARGNNVGFSYCKEKLDPDYIIFCNNDIIINQQDFLGNISKAYELCPFDVLGPNIVSPDGKHQSPLRLQSSSENELKKLLFKTKLKMFILRLGGIAEKQFYKHRENKSVLEQSTPFDWSKPNHDCIVSGACMIFSRRFIESHDWAFYPETFMYLEESILGGIIKHEGGKMCYSPLPQVVHMHEVATRSSTATEHDYYMFLFNQYIKSINIALNLIRSGYHE